MVLEQFRAALAARPEPGAWLHINEEDLERAKKLVEQSYSDPILLSLYDQGDKLSSSQTKHDIEHAFSVRDVALALMHEYEGRFPGVLDDWTKYVVIPLAAFLHDIGRAVDVNDHARAGAGIAHLYLRFLKFPPVIRRRICRIIMLHRSSSVLEREFDDRAWAIVVIADKCVGDEDRVRPNKARILRLLRFFGLARLNCWLFSPHDRVNFAIKEANLIVDVGDEFSQDAGAVVLKLQLDEKVAIPREVTTLYGDRFHSCGRAAQYLGFVFRIEFNGVRFHYNKQTKSWEPITQIVVPRP